MSDALLEAALAAAREAGARHAEVRLVRRTRERLAFRDGALDSSLADTDVGLGVRALVGDGWGYGATSLLTTADVAEAARAAVAAARGVTATAEIALPPPITGRYATPLSEDPFAVPIGEKAAVFADAHTAAKGAKATRGELTSLRVDTEFATGHGTRLSQSITLCGAGLIVIAAGDGDVQIRSYPCSQGGNVLQGGFEHVRAMDLPGAAPRLAREAQALLSADPTPSGRRTVVLDGSQLSLQIHESVGHPTELDRAFGEEISLAGASFLLPDQALDRLRYGSDRVNLTADATTPYGPGTFGFDDEGTPATRTPLVRAGRFVGYLSGRDTAARLGRPSASCLRAESWSAQPIVRMINVNLEPGEGSVDDLIGGVDDGLLLDCNKSWSIDDLRLNFQFSTEIAYEIRGGRLTGRVFKNPVYHGVTPSFWGACSAIAGPEAWRMWGLMYCGKGDPVQLMYVGHGCAPARFDGVDVRASR